MEINVPSIALNKFFNSPNAGSTVGKAEEFVQPVLETREFIYPIIHVAISATADTTTNVGRQGGAGWYRFRGLLTGVVTNGANAGYVLIYLTSASGDDNMILHRVWVTAAQIYSITPVILDFIYDMSMTPEVGNWNVVISSPAAIASEAINLYLTVQRVI